MRLLLVTLVLALTGTLAVDLQPGSAPRAARPVAMGAVKTVVRPKTVEVALLRNGRIARVERIVPKGAALPGTRSASFSVARRERSVHRASAPRSRGARSAFASSSRREISGASASRAGCWDGPLGGPSRRG